MNEVGDREFIALSIFKSTLSIIFLQTVSAPLG
jgi:hypothetical protein